MRKLFAAVRGRGAFALSVSLLVLSGAGCGGRATVTGQVTYRGNPLPSGSVNFFDANKNIVGTATIANGSYSIADLPPGSVTISVTTSLVRPADRRHPPPKDMPGGQLAPSLPIPLKYGNPEQSGLAYEVQSGEQEHKIELN
ncbi:MAG TPA: carboxypeptidase-like regulatory domain-containing protein [Gemmataceae bacterium]|jgi:hypothetical protein